MVKMKDRQASLCGMQLGSDRFMDTVSVVPGIEWINLVINNQADREKAVTHAQGKVNEALDFLLQSEKLVEKPKLLGKAVAGPIDKEISILSVLTKMPTDTSLYDLVGGNDPVYAAHLAGLLITEVYEQMKSVAVSMMITSISGENAHEFVKSREDLALYRLNKELAGRGHIPVIHTREPAAGSAFYQGPKKGAEVGFIDLFTRFDKYPKSHRIWIALKRPADRPVELSSKYSYKTVKHLRAVGFEYCLARGIIVPFFSFMRPVLPNPHQIGGNKFHARFGE